MNENGTTTADVAVFAGGGTNLPMARKIWPRLMGKRIASVRQKKRRRRRVRRRKGKTGPGSLIGRLVAEALEGIAEGR